MCLVKSKTAVSELPSETVCRTVTCSKRVPIRSSIERNLGLLTPTVTVTITVALSVPWPPNPNRNHLQAELKHVKKAADAFLSGSKSVEAVADVLMEGAEHEVRIPYPPQCPGLGA